MNKNKVCAALLFALGALVAGIGQDHGLWALGLFGGSMMVIAVVWYFDLSGAPLNEPYDDPSRGH